MTQSDATELQYRHLDSVQSWFLKAMANRWMATLGVKPQDFTAARWTRDNRVSLQKVVELDAEDLEDRVDDLEVSVDGFQGDVESVESQVTRLDGKVDAVSSGLQQNRRQLSEVEDRVDDSVERVDATRQEFHGFRTDVVDEMQSMEKEIDSVESWFSEEVRDTQDLVQEESVTSSLKYRTWRRLLNRVIGSRIGCFGRSW